MDFNIETWNWSLIIAEKTEAKVKFNAFDDESSIVKDHLSFILEAVWISIEKRRKSHFSLFSMTSKFKSSSDNFDDICEHAKESKL